MMVPTLNEQKGIGRVLEDVPKDIDVLVVDGGSTDETVEVARQYRVRVINQKFGRGKGSGVRTGMGRYGGKLRLNHVDKKLGNQQLLNKLGRFEFYIFFLGV